MTRTDRNHIVTRSCATIPKREEGCEEDDRGALLCYCLTSYCNDGVATTRVKRDGQFVLIIAWTVMTVTRTAMLAA